MYPELFHWGFFKVHTYGFLVAMGFLIALEVIKRLAVKAQCNVQQILDLSFGSLWVGFLGARILFVLTRFNFFLDHPLEIIKIWEGGFVFFGGPLAAIPWIVFYVNKHRLPLWKVLDILTPGLVIAHSIGRLGCFAAGCCYGRPTSGIFGVRFYSELVEDAFRGIPLHPTQLYESFALFLLFLILLTISRKKTFDGQVTFTYLLSYPILRFFIEIFRGDLIRGFIIPQMLSTSQLISLLIFVLSIIILFSRVLPFKEVTCLKKKSEHKKK